MKKTDPFPGPYGITLRFHLSPEGTHSRLGVWCVLRHKCIHTPLLRTWIATFLESQDAAASLHIGVLLAHDSPTLKLLVRGKTRTTVSLEILDGLTLHLVRHFRKFLGAPVVNGGVFSGSVAVSTWPSDYNFENKKMGKTGVIR